MKKTPAGPVQLRFADVGLEPLEHTGDARLYEEQRQAAIEASHRLLDAVEERARNTPGIRDDDREMTLVNVKRRRRLLPPRRESEEAST